MKHSIRVGALALVLVLALAVPSSAGWVDDDITGIVDNVKNLKTRVAEVKADTQDALSNLQEMLPSFRDGVDTVKDDLETLVDLTLAQTRMLAENELAGLQAFIGSEEEAAFRKELVALVLQLETRTNDLLALLPEVAPPCSNRQRDLSIDFKPILDLVRSVPGAVLYPLYRTKQIAGNLYDELLERLQCAAQYRDLVAGLLLDTTSPEEVREAPDLYKVALRRLWVEAQMLTFLGGQMQAAAKTAKLDGEVAIWGWVGGGIDVDAAGSLGGVLTTIGTAEKWIWEMAHRNVKQLELVAFQNQILANQATIMDNQKRILRAIWTTR